MRFGERIVVFIFRPIYRTFFDRLIWWFLAKVKVFMLADIGAQLQSIEQRLRAIEERDAAGVASNAAQWDALEQLLLALFRSSELRSSDTNRDTSTSQVSLPSDTDSNRVHAASNMR